MIFLLLISLTTKGQGIGIEHEKFSGEVIQTGRFLPDYVSAKTGQKWLALIQKSSDQLKLSSVTIRVKNVPKEIGQAGPECEVSINKHPGKTVFLFRGIPGLKPRIVESLSTGMSLRPNVPVDLKLKNGVGYKLTLVCPPATRATRYETVTASLVLEKGELKQTLTKYSFPYVDGKIEGGTSGEVKLFWAGDLNADGSLDLLIDVSSNYCSYIPALFLGNPEGSKSMATKVAQFKSGC